MHVRILNMTCRLLKRYFYFFTFLPFYSFPRLLPLYFFTFLPLPIAFYLFTFLPFYSFPRLFTFLLLYIFTF